MNPMNTHSVFECLFDFIDNLAMNSNLRFHYLHFGPNFCFLDCLFIFLQSTFAFIYWVRILVCIYIWCILVCMYTLCCYLGLHFNFVFLCFPKLEKCGLGFAASNYYIYSL